MSNYKVRVYTDLQAILKIEESIISKLRIFHTTAWLSMVGKNLIAITCEENGILKGYLPLVKTFKFGLTAYHIPPFTPYFGPIIFEDDLLKRGEVIENLLGPVLKESHLDFLLEMPTQDILSYLKLGFTINGYQNHIAENPETHLIHPSKRRYLKKLEAYVNSGDLIIEKGNEAILGIIELNELTSKRAGFKSNNPLLKTIVENIGESKSELLLIKDKEGIPLAGAFCPRDQFAWYDLINASARSDNKLLDKANLLSVSLLIKGAFKENCVFDFEGSSIPGVANFYRMMGGQPVIKYRIQKSRSLYFHFLRFIKSVKNERI